LGLQSLNIFYQRSGGSASAALVEGRIGGL
jgi:hypothetical protein